MSSSTPIFPPGVSAPLGRITQTDQSGLIAIITALSMCFVLVSSSVHVYVRLSSRSWKTDDYILVAGAVLACIQSGLVFYEIHKGLGKVPSLVHADDQVEIKKTYYANNILYILVLCLSKSSMGFLYLRLTRSREHLRVIYAILGASIVWAVMSLPLICIDCSWRTGCSNAFARWLSIGVFDCLTDIALILMSVYLVRRLQVSLSRKMTVVGAFATRILLIPACAVRLHYLNPSTLSSDRNFALSLAVVCSQLQLGYSIMTSSISSFKPFISVYEKPATTTDNYHSRYMEYGANSHGSKTKNSFRLDPLSSASSRNKRYDASLPVAESALPSDAAAAAASLVPDNHGRYLATVSVHDKPTNSENDRRSLRSDGSRQMIIERETGWSVHYDSDSGKDEALETTRSYRHRGQVM